MPHNNVFDFIVGFVALGALCLFQVGVAPANFGQVGLQLRDGHFAYQFLKLHFLLAWSYIFALALKLLDDLHEHCGLVVLHLHLGDLVQGVHLEAKRAAAHRSAVQLVSERQNHLEKLD